MLVHTTDNPFSTKAGGMTRGITSVNTKVSKILLFALYLNIGAVYHQFNILLWSKTHTEQLMSNIVLCSFTARHYASAVYMLSSCLSVCLSVTRRCCIKTAKHRLPPAYVKNHMPKSDQIFCTCITCIVIVARYSAVRCRYVVHFRFYGWWHFFHIMDRLD